MAPALVLAVLAAVGAFRAYRVADRKVKRRDEQIRHLKERNAELRAEADLNAQACDRQRDDAVALRADLARLSGRNAEMRDQVDALTGAGTEPTFTEKFLAWLSEEPITYPEDPR